MSITISHLPDGVLLHIFSQLPRPDLHSAMRTCKQWASLGREERLRRPARLGDSFGEVSSRALYSCCPPPSRAMVAALASFIHRGHITEVENMTLWNLDLAELPYAASLADVTVTGEVNIARVSGHIAPVLSRIRCSCLSLDHMRLSAGDTRALVTAMMTSVDMVELGLGPAVGSSSSRGGLELDWDTLLLYDGRGRCGTVWCRWGAKLPSAK